MLSVRFIVVGGAESDVVTHLRGSQCVFELAEIGQSQVLWTEEAFRFDLGCQKIKAVVMHLARKP